MKKENRTFLITAILVLLVPFYIFIAAFLVYPADSLIALYAAILFLFWVPALYFFFLSGIRYFYRDLSLATIMYLTAAVFILSAVPLRSMYIRGVISHIKTGDPVSNSGLELMEVEMP